MKGIVIIPAYNPDRQLVEIVEKVWSLGNQVIVVDDGSNPSCQDIFEEVGKSAIVIHHEENKGKGAALKTACCFIQKEIWDSDVAGVMDADGQHRPEDMEKLLEEASASKMTMVLGVRTIDKAMPIKSRFGNALTRKIFKLVSGVGVSDTQTGLRAFDVALIPELLKVSGERYEYEMNVLLTLAKEKISMKEVPIMTIYHDRDNSCSHFHAVRDSIRIYKEIFKFTLSSLSSFFLDYVLFVVFNFLLSPFAMGTVLANVCARMISGYYNYHMNVTHVFRQKKNLQNALQYFLLATGILIGNSLLLTFYHNVIHIPVYPAKLLTEFTLFFVSFSVQKGLMYRGESIKKTIL